MGHPPPHTGQGALPATPKVGVRAETTSQGEQACQAAAWVGSTGMVLLWGAKPAPWVPLFPPSRSQGSPGAWWDVWALGRKDSAWDGGCECHRQERGCVFLVLCRWGWPNGPREPVATRASGVKSTYHKLRNKIRE